MQGSYGEQSENGAGRSEETMEREGLEGPEGPEGPEGLEGRMGEWNERREEWSERGGLCWLTLNFLVFGLILEPLPPRLQVTLTGG